MGRLRFDDIAHKPITVLDMTSLTVEEFQSLLPAFEAAFQAHMADWCLDGRPRTARRYTTYKNCPLPSAQDRLLFILVYLKTHPIQVAHGLLFGLPQGKTNTWIHVLLPILRASLRTLGDAPSRTLSDLARRLGLTDLAQTEAVQTEAAQTEAVQTEAAQTETSPPLFAMMEPNGEFHAPKTQMNRKAVSAARKSIIQ